MIETTVVLSVCECVRVFCLRSHRGPCTGLIRWHCGVAKLQRVMVCQLLHHKLVAWTAALFCLSHFLSFLFVCLIFPVLLFISVFLILCLFLRPESSGDSAAFLSTSRSFSGYELLAAAAWSERSTAVGQQSRPQPLHRCSLART